MKPLTVAGYSHFRDDKGMVVIRTGRADRRALQFMYDHGFRYFNSGGGWKPITEAMLRSN